MNFFGNKDIKLYVKRHLTAIRADLVGKKIIDVPAGTGYTSQLLKEMGLDVEAYDLFPEFFNVAGMTCAEADIARGLPLPDGYADYVICQEGIEHLSDQVEMFREFNRILAKGGTLLVTTPNYSNLRSKLSYYRSESEYFGKIMPPNENDSIWFSDGKKDDLYYGHIFSLGIQKMRVMARIAGFRIGKIHHLNIKHTSFFLLLFTYPFILLANTAGYRRAKRLYPERNPDAYREVYRLSIDPRILVDGHLCVEFSKEAEVDEAAKRLSGKYKSTRITT